jgi:7-cyano-7-deazaguanine synthase
MAKRRVVALMSGGLDSCVLVGQLLSEGREVEAISFDYGQRHRVELDHARLVSEAYGIKQFELNARLLGGLAVGSALTDDTAAVPHGHYEAESMKATVVPNRNMALLSLAAVRAISTSANVAIAAHAGDHVIYPDCRDDFMTLFQATVRVGNWDAHEFAVLRPFVNMSKSDIVRLGARINAPMHLTWSCYEGGAKHCGACGTCVERREAFELAGVNDPTEYAQ